MTEDLHDVLERTADLAGPAAIDSDALWREATRSRRRHGAVTSLAVVAILALVSVALWWGHGPTTRSTTPPAAGSTPVMPTHLHPTSEGIFAQARSDRLDIGPVAAVLVTQVGLPVAVSALDGSYHRLKLPGFNSSSDDAPIGAGVFNTRPAVVVSPDGSRVAYPWHAPLPSISGAHIASGVRVLDTVSGRVSTYSVPGGVGVACGALSWSANQRYLVYSCFVLSELDVAHADFESVQLERLDLSSGRRSVPPIGQDVPARAAVADDGSVAVASAAAVQVWSPQTGQVEQGDTDVLNGPFSLGWSRSDQALVVTGSSPRGVVYQRVSRPDGSGAVRGPLERLAGPSSDTLRVVGTVDPGQVAFWLYQGRRGVLLTWSPGESLVWRVTVTAGRAPPQDHYSFATDLLRSPTRDTGPSVGSAAEVPGSRSAAVAGIIGLTVAGTVVVGVWWVRRRRLVTGAEVLTPPHARP